jgi:hypothetical protein
MTRKSRLLLLLPLVVALLSGCGGSEASSGSTGSSARAQLIAKADPICEATIKRRLEEEKRLSAASTSGPPLKALASSAPGLAASQSRAVSQLRELSPPATLAKDWQSMLAALQQLATDTARIGAYAKEKNVKALEKVVRTGGGTRRRLASIATRDGLAPCARAN